MDAEIKSFSLFAQYAFEDSCSFLHVNWIDTRGVDAYEHVIALCDGRSRKSTELKARRVRETRRCHRKHVRRHGFRMWASLMMPNYLGSEKKKKLNLANSQA